jgi:prepilin-type N-terminal cleavage/methylation domain-containing protein
MRGEAGFTVPELLLAMAIMLVVAGATLATFESFTVTAKRNGDQNDSQEVARSTVTALSRQLRNLAGPTEGQPEAFDRVEPDDLVFKTIDPKGPASGDNRTNVQRVRYCLDGATPQRLWTQVQTWTSAVPPQAPAGTACPDPAWGNQRVAATGMVNGARPAFLFDSTDPAAVTQVRVDLHVDADPARAPGETRLQTGVFLRNQNRVPVAAFQAAPGGRGHVVLNASASSDPEGQPLAYTWKDGATKLDGDSVVYDYATASGTHTIQLEVRDPAGLVARQAQEVRVP